MSIMYSASKKMGLNIIALQNYVNLQTNINKSVQASNSSLRREANSLFKFLGNKIYRIRIKLLCLTVTDVVEFLKALTIDVLLGYG